MNIFGLSVAIACAIVVFLFLERQYTMDRFHENGRRIFLVESYIDRSSSRQLWGDSPMPLGPAMAADFPQIERFVRVSYGNGTFQTGDKVFDERLWFVDEEFLDMFSFGLQSGTVQALSDPNAIVLSDNLATKYFGTENPIGQQITITFNDDFKDAFTVLAVAEPFPIKSSFSFNALIQLDKLKALNVELTNWARFTGATFIEVGNPDDIDVISSQMEPYRALQNAAIQDWPISEFVFDNLYNLSVHSQDVRGDISSGTHPTAIIVLGLVAIFMLALSCFNYMNLAIATASRRLKEIGVRKVVGSSKSQLIGQFLSENIFLCLLALGLGYIIAYFLFIPGFNNLFDFVGGSISLNSADQKLLWPFLIGLLLLTGVVSGAYPAFFIASFQPTAIFRGRQKMGGGNVFTKALLTFQFVLAFLTMIMGVVLAQNADYQANKDWGYDTDHLLVLQFDEGSQYAVLRDALTQLPSVQTVVGARNHFYRSWSRPVLDIEGEKMEAVRFDVGDGFLKQYGVALKAGRDFEGEISSDEGGSVIINETFARSRGWTNDSAIDQTFRRDSLTYSVIGVATDFMYDDFYDPLEPAFLRITREENFRYLTMRIQSGADAQTAEEVESLWKTIFPDQPYPGFFQDTLFDELYRQNTNIKQLFAFIAALALVIACLGLFGIAAQNIVRRMKEISIRKVLGGSVSHISQVINRGFLLLVGLAAVIATPLGYVAMKMLLESVYADPVPLGIFPFILSFSFVLTTAVATIATQIYRVVYNNPAEVLRNE